MQDVNVGSDYKYSLVRGETHENNHAYRIKVNYLFTVVFRNTTPQ